MTIRKSLDSAKEYLERCAEYASVFSENNLKHWPHYKNREDYIKIYSLDDNTKKAFEQIYSVGRDCAIAMSSQLRSFNHADEHPTLTDFIKSFDGGWVYQTERLKAVSKKAKDKCEETINCPWAVEQMIILFDNQLSLLKATQNTLEILKQTRLYKIENGEAHVEKENQNINISEVSGNTRININSQDNSTNTNISADRNVFNEIKSAFNSSSINTSEKEAILNKLEELEKSVDSGKFPEKYKDFIALAANHMTILAPFLPALTTFIS